MTCWLCESPNASQISNEVTPREMLLTLFPNIQPKLPSVLDFCKSCFKELYLYYKFRINYSVHLKKDEEIVKNEDCFIDLTEDAEDPKGTCCICSKRIFGIVNFIEEGDDSANDIVAASLVRKFFPHIKLEQYESPQACDRCSEMVKGLYEYEQKCMVKTVIDSVIQVDVKLTEKEMLLKSENHDNFLASLNENTSIDTCSNSQEMSASAGKEMLLKSENHDNFLASLNENMSIDTCSNSQEMSSSAISEEASSSNADIIYNNNNFTFKIESIVSAKDDDIDSDFGLKEQNKEDTREEIVLSDDSDDNDQEMRELFSKANIPYENRRHFLDPDDMDDEDEEEDSKIPLSNFVDDFKPFEMDDNMFTNFQTPKGKEYKCKYCLYTSNRKDNMRRHVFIRHIKKKIMQQCHFCSFRTTSETIMQRHVDDRHINAVRTFPCQICDYKGERYSQLQAHMKLMHTVDKKKSPNELFKCNMCDFITSRDQYLQKHIRYKHADVMVYLDCVYCNYKTRRKDNLKQHMLHMHMKVEKDEEYHKCQLCGFQTNRKDKIKRHLECVHGQEDNKPCYRCGVCNYECTRKDTLKRHVEYQHLKKDIVFKCNMCKYQTDIFDYLQKHIKYAHTQQVKLFECHLCPYTTYKKILFGQHYRRRHGCAPPLELQDRCECFYKAGGHNSSCTKCRKNYEEMEEDDVICLDDEYESSSQGAVGNASES